MGFVPDPQSPLIRIYQRLYSRALFRDRRGDALALAVTLGYADYQLECRGCNNTWWLAGNQQLLALVGQL